MKCAAATSSRLAYPRRPPQQLRQLGEVRRQPPRLVVRQPIWSPSDATQRYVRNRGRSGSARLALETTLMTDAVEKVGFRLERVLQAEGIQLARADVGIAMGTGTDIAIESAQVTLVKGDLNGIVRARALSHRWKRPWLVPASSAGLAPIPAKARVAAGLRL